MGFCCGSSAIKQEATRGGNIKKEEPSAPFEKYDFKFVKRPLNGIVSESN